jgi:geranylgeranyl diphosphate synthase type II
MDPNVKSLLVSGAKLTDEALERLLPGPETLPHSIHRAMRHSTFAGGKRLRPILCIEAARMLAGGTTPAGIANLGAAIEMLHTYSLIHDDLPALDNDDLRRGQPTCHVAFGEATAILAGDALQTLAFQTIAELPAPPATVVAILREVAIAVGTGVGCVGDTDTPLAPGMIGGQVMDIESEGHPPTAALVEAIHRAKTGALITVSIVAGGLYGLPQARMGGSDGSTKDLFKMSSAGRARFREAVKRPIEENLATIKAASDATHTKNVDTVARLRTFGQKAGLAFQIIDDVLDMTQSSEELGKTAGKDTASDKATWPAVFGIERSRHDAAELIADAFAALAPFGEAAASLKSLAQYLVERKN